MTYEANPDKIGLYMLQIVKAGDEDIYCDLGDKMRCAGIYKPEDVPRDVIQSITYTTIPSEGEPEENITTRVTITLDGTVLQEKEDESGTLVSTQESTVSADTVQGLIDLLYENYFFDLPPGISGDEPIPTDGYRLGTPRPLYFESLEVLTESKSYVIGGPNPNEERVQDNFRKRFASCCDAVEELVRR